MQLNDLQREHKNKTKTRVGRGGKRGKTSGRGHKGQKQHGGHGLRPEMRDIIKKLPKLRGYKFNSIQNKSIPVNLSTIESSFENGEKVTPKTLELKKIVRIRKGNKLNVKILGTGEITKKLEFSGCSVSKKAIESIEKAGGSVIK